MNGMVIQANCVEQYGLFSRERCRQALQTPSSTIQMELQEHFDFSVSISQLNRVRAALGVSNHSKYTEPGKKDGRGRRFPQPEWQEGAFSLLLLASAHQTGLLTELQTPLSPRLLGASRLLRRWAP
jgi:hypothetical protein